MLIFANSIGKYTLLTRQIMEDSYPKSISQISKDLISKEGIKPVIYNPFPFLKFYKPDQEQKDQKKYLRVDNFINIFEKQKNN